MKRARTNKFFSSDIKVSNYYHEINSFVKKYNFALPLYNIKNWQIHVLNNICKTQTFFCNIYCQEKNILDIKKIKFYYRINYIDYYSLADFVENNYVFNILKSISKKIVLKILNNKLYLIINNKKFHLTPNIQKKYFGFLVFNDKFTFLKNCLNIFEIKIITEYGNITISLSEQENKYILIDGVKLIGVSYFFFKSLKEKYVAYYY